MSFLLWSTMSLVVLLTIASVVMSFFVTRRHYLTGTRSPAELGLGFEDVTFTSTDGLTLRGWWIPAPGSDRTIIQLHGHAGSMDADIEYASAWHAAGFNVLMFDLRAHGRSEGRACTFGYLERYDVQGAIRYLKQEQGAHRIALIGFSLGGMVAILSAPACPEVDVVVEDGAPIRLRTVLTVWGIRHNLSAWFAPIPAWLAVFGMSLRLGANLFRYEPVRWVGEIAPRPLMVVHGDLDHYVPDFEDLLVAAHPAAVWRDPEMGHCQSKKAYPEEYRARVLAFLDRYL